MAIEITDPDLKVMEDFIRTVVRPGVGPRISDVEDVFRALHRTQARLRQMDAILTRIHQARGNA